jgi:hypothetical protein
MCAAVLDERRRTWCEVHAAERRAEQSRAKSARYREKQKAMAAAGERVLATESGEVLVPVPVLRRLEKAADLLNRSLAGFDQDMGPNAAYVAGDPDGELRREHAPKFLRLAAGRLLTEVRKILEESPKDLRAT